MTQGHVVRHREGRAAEEATAQLLGPDPDGPAEPASQPRVKLRVGPGADGGVYRYNAVVPLMPDALSD